MKLNESVLIKLNKNSLADIILQLVNLYEKHSKTCKSAAVKLDHLKTERIKTGKTLRARTKEVWLRREERESKQTANGKSSEGRCKILWRRKTEIIMFSDKQLQRGKRWIRGFYLRNCNGCVQKGELRTPNIVDTEFGLQQVDKQGQSKLRWSILPMFRPY